MKSLKCVKLFHNILRSQFKISLSSGEAPFWPLHLSHAILLGVCYRGVSCSASIPAKHPDLRAYRLPFHQQLLSFHQRALTASSISCRRHSTRVLAASMVRSFAGQVPLIPGLCCFFLLSLGAAIVIIVRTSLQFGALVIFGSFCNRLALQRHHVFADMAFGIDTQSTISVV